LESIRGYRDLFGKASGRVTMDDILVNPGNRVGDCLVVALVVLNNGSIRYVVLAPGGNEAYLWTKDDVLDRQWTS
jgi:hypothetical protein